MRLLPHRRLHLRPLRYELMSEEIANRTNHFAGAHCVNLAGLRSALESGILGLVAILMMGLNTLFGLLPVWIGERVEFGLGL